MKARCVFSETILVLAGVAMALPTLAVGANISGDVTLKSGDPVRGVRVELRDAVNAELLAETDTDFSGAYDSGMIPSGSYRIRIWATEGAETPCCAKPVYFGADSDTFCLGSSVAVAPDATEIVDLVLPIGPPILVVTDSGRVSGVVTDAVTGAPIEGILVSLLHGADAVEVVPVKANAITDALGQYVLAVKIRGTVSVAVRFSDPAGEYFPEYFGTGGRDEFCAASLLRVRDLPVANAALTPITPDALTEVLLDAIDELPVPAQVDNLLSTPLQRATDLLTDGNTNNDGAVCHQLDSFITRVEIQQGKGQLSPDEAHGLIEDARAVQAALGCS